MGNIYKVISGIGVLIALYLFLSNATDTVRVINSLSSAGLNGIQVLQGREKLITK